MSSRDQSARGYRAAAFQKFRARRRSARCAGCCALRARAAGPLKQVTMTLDWIYQGPNVGFMLAQDKGFYRDAGLDVAITSGKGSGSTAQLVASKATQIGFADGYVVGNGVSKGMAIKTVGSVFRRKSGRHDGARRFRDRARRRTLAGKTVAMTAGSAQFQQWPAFVKGAGIDAAKVQVVNIDPAGVGPALINDKVDAIGGYAQGYVPAIEIRGKKQVRIFWFADYGVTVVSNGIIVHDDLLQERSRSACARSCRRPSRASSTAASTRTMRSPRS